VTPRGVTQLEMMVVAAIIAILAAALVVPSYRGYEAARAPIDAAATLAQDLAVLERAAQAGPRDEGATLIVVSDDPLVYRGYRGRPESLDPNSSLGAMLLERRFSTVRLAGGPIGMSTPLLFASDGRAQYMASGLLSDPHTTVEITLSQRPSGRTATVGLDLFTGAISE
jgi:prepilin-type N-terminal cleavage/methylation domain-containing protein